MSKIQLLKRSKKMFYCFPAICLLLSGCGLFNNSVQPINIVTEESTVLDNNRTQIDNKKYNYTNNDTESFPTIKEIEHRLRVVANQEILTDKNANYFDWEQYGSLEEQRKYFSEIILNTTK